MRAVTELENFRREKDDFLGRDHRSPLTSSQQRTFKGLEDFPENPGLVFKAKIDRKVEPGVVLLETTNGREQVYGRYGVIHFLSDGQAAPGTLYASAGDRQ